MRSATLMAIFACAMFGLFQPTAHAQSSDEVIVTVPQFGVGNWSRSGDWTAIQVNLSDQGSQVREIVVWIEIKDSDGDYPRFYRELATAPGEVKSIWLFAQLPLGFRSGSFPVHVNEASTDAEGKLQIGKRLGQTQATARFVASEVHSLTAIVGNSPAGLLGYTPRQQNNSNFAIGGNERMILTAGLEVSGLPDRWMGLVQFDTIVWTAGSAMSLSVDQAAAIREWVIRGGHFVIVMRSGDVDWITSARFNALYSIMPMVNIDRIEGVDYEKYRGLLAAPQTKAGLPSNQTVHVFTPSERLARKTDAIRLITDSDDQCVVTTRIVGTGAVTLVGLNLTSTALVYADRPHIEAFWNRVLGRRDESLTKDEIEEGRFSQGRDQAVYDRQISDRIDAKGAATQGVMLGFVVFLAYWLVAAPVSFILLKKANLLRFAWLAFVAATVIFTGISWGGVAIIKPKTGHNRHVTFLEHVYGPSIQRTRTYLSVLVPEYGDATVSVGNPVDDGGEQFNNIITPFGNYNSGGAFPDSRGYVINATDPSSFSFPVRSTIKEFRVDWAGSTDWSMIRPIGGGAKYPTEPGEIRVTRRSPTGEGVHVLEGVIEHNLPAELRDVVIIVTRGPRFRENKQDIFSQPPYVFSMKSSWKPGVPYPLETITLTEDPKLVTRIDSWLDNQRNASWKDGGAPPRALLAAGLINMMPPPERDDTREMTPLRSLMHGWDLGRWFTQPCVIVMGIVGDTQNGAECPTPLQLNGKPLDSNGITIVRWIYPLPENPLKIELIVDPNAPAPETPGDGNG